MDNLIKQAERVKKLIKAKEKDIDNPALTASTLNQLDFFIENVEDVISLDDDFFNDVTYCDRCKKKLDMLKNEDIYLEKIDEVVCADCHTDDDVKNW